MKKFTLHKLKTRAPKIPEYSCPVIDEIIADLSTDPNMTAKKFSNVNSEDYYHVNPVIKFNALLSLDGGSNYEKTYVASFSLYFNVRFGRK